MSVNLNRAPRAATNRDRAEAAWPAGLPEWVGMLADACDRLGQRTVAAAIGKTGGYVSRILNQKYAGDYVEAERLTRAAFSDARIECPAMSTSMSLRTCMTNRRRTAPPVNFMHHAFARACPECPSNTDREDD